MREITISSPIVLDLLTFLANLHDIPYITLDILIVKITRIVVVTI